MSRHSITIKYNLIHRLFNIVCNILNGSTEYSKGNKTIPEKVTTTRTEDRQK